MKTNESFLNFDKTQEATKKQLDQCNQGVTKRLLEKYKPSLGLKAIDGGKAVNKKQIAA